jgi:hypothetical protein
MFFRAVPHNVLTTTVLQNGRPCVAKRAVWHAKTARFARPNGLFGRAEPHRHDYA